MDAHTHGLHVKLPYGYNQNVLISSFSE